ncbi:MAG: hypothetical protein QM811_22675 [Pirellulales bacterium]
MQSRASPNTTSTSCAPFFRVVQVEEPRLVARAEFRDHRIDFIEHDLVAGFLAVGGQRAGAHADGADLDVAVVFGEITDRAAHAATADVIRRRRRATRRVQKLRPVHDATVVQLPLGIFQTRLIVALRIEIVADRDRAVKIVRLV